MIRREVFICDCHSLEHQVWFTYDEDDAELILEIHLTQRGFFGRLWYALMYLFGHRSRFGAFDELILGPDSVKKLKDHLNAF